MEYIVESNKLIDWKQNAVNILKKYEWLHLTSYCDRLIYKGNRYIKSCPTGRERYSIGYGTLSFPWEKITEQEAERRMLEAINPTFEYLEQFSCYTDNQKTAIADFIYNAWINRKHNRTWIPFRTYVEACNHWVIEWFLNPRNYASVWLQRRRQAQYNYWVSQ